MLGGRMTVMHPTRVRKLNSLRKAGTTMLILRKLALAQQLFGAVVLSAMCALVATGQASSPLAPAPQTATQSTAPPPPVLTMGSAQNRFQGSVPTGQATGTALPLSLK